MQIPHFELGTSITLETTFKNLAGVPTNPSSATLRIKRPDLTETSITPTSGAVGEFSAVFAPTQSGLHEYKWDGDGAVDAASIGAFVVNPSSFV